MANLLGVPGDTLADKIKRRDHLRIELKGLKLKRKKLSWAIKKVEEKLTELHKQITPYER